MPTVNTGDTWHLALISAPRYSICFHFIIHKFKACASRRHSKQMKLAVTAHVDFPILNFLATFWLDRPNILSRGQLRHGKLNRAHGTGIKVMNAPSSVRKQTTFHNAPSSARKQTTFHKDTPKNGGSTPCIMRDMDLDFILPTNFFLRYPIQFPNPFYFEIYQQFRFLFLCLFSICNSNRIQT
jgi:hypothetical protein